MRKLLLLLCLAACTNNKHNHEELVVFAASSLQEPFEKLELEMEHAHPGLDVRLVFAGSQELRTQLEHGAEADVVAFADEKTMSAISSLTDEPVLFAWNTLVVITEQGTVSDFWDLPAANRIVLGVPEVPIGRYADKVLDKADAARPGFAAGVRAKVVSRELNVKQVLAKLVHGEADAVIVYASDTPVVAKNLVVVQIPPEINVSAAYPVAVLRGARQRKRAEEWVALLRSQKGQEALVNAGFKTSP